jgi:hypothetical protein
MHWSITRLEGGRKSSTLKYPDLVRIMTKFDETCFVSGVKGVPALTCIRARPNMPMSYSNALVVSKEIGKTYRKHGVPAEVILRLNAEHLATPINDDPESAQTFSPCRGGTSKALDTYIDGESARVVTESLLAVALREHAGSQKVVCKSSQW